MVVFNNKTTVESVQVVVESQELPTPRTPVSKVQRKWRKSVVLGLLRNIIPGNSSSHNNFHRQLSDIDTSGQRIEQSPNENSKYEIAIDESSGIATTWSTLISLACIYNLIAVPLLSFDDLTNQYYNVWLGFNFVADIFYILDIPFQCFISYYSAGLLIRDVRRIGKHYSRQSYFILDIISIVPTDILLIKWNEMSILRINRLAKCYKIFDHLSKAQMRTKYVNFIVMSKVIIPIVFIFHWNACGYYALSVYYGIEDADSSDWAFSYEKIMDPLFSDCNWLPWDRDCEFDETPHNGTKEDYVELMEEYWDDKLVIVNFTDLTKKYTLSFYWSSMTLTTLGEQPQPNYSLQNVYEIMNTVIGILIFGAIMGSVAEIVHNANIYKRRLKTDMDKAKIFMINRQVEQQVQSRVFAYFDYAVSTRYFLQDPTQSDSLTTPLRKDIRKQMLMDTFRKVELFKDVSNVFLEELISSVYLRLYGPNDFLCLRGDVCREMFIVENGALIELNSKRKTTRRLSKDDCYGELSMIYVAESIFENRHPSTVLSIGFSEVYVLSVDEFRRLLKDFPGVKDDLDTHTRSRLAEIRMLRTEEEMTSIRKPDLPALDLDDQLQQIKQSVLQLQLDINLHNKKIETSQFVVNKQLISMEVRMQSMSRHNSQMPTTSSNFNKC